MAKRKSKPAAKRAPAIEAKAERMINRLREHYCLGQEAIRAGGSPDKGSLPPLLARLESPMADWNAISSTGRAGESTPQALYVFQTPVGQ
jgi:hypothetical protein